ncbi:MAG: M28 family peptidase [bacterium]
MKRQHLLLILFLSIPGTIFCQITPWMQWTFLPDPLMHEIIGESSGENAWYMIMETGGYDKNRSASEYESMFYETKFYLDKMKEYNLPGAELVRFPGGETWDGVKGELWEVKPMRQKLSSYRDHAAMLASGSPTCDVSGELVWIGSGRQSDFEGKELKDKIVVTESSVSQAYRLACIEKGAAGVISIYSPRPNFDPLQMSWANVGRGGRRSEAAAAPAKFGFQIPAREGEYLKKRLLAGEKITVRAQVESQQRKYDLQDLVCYIPGSDPTAGEVILSAHLFEGYVKQGGNDDISGCAAILEVARTLNTLISEGRLPKPKRTIRFLWGPEFSGTGPWVKANKELMNRTLCNINMDMVGEWLSKNKASMCLMRTTYGGPHYINDVVENYYRFVGEGNREKIQNRSKFYPVSDRIIAPTGADEPFHYSIETHYGASDHEVFNDWGVQVPGIMMIAWPDQWYHTSGDHVDKADATQLRRVVVIGAASAYTIANADDEMAVKIAGEIVSNATRRLGHQLVRGLEELNHEKTDSLTRAYQLAQSYIEAAVINEKNTLESVLQLATDKKRVGEYISLAKKTIEATGQTQMNALENHIKTIASRANVKPVALKLSELEKKASKIIPRQTDKVKANGYGGYRELINQVPQAVRDKFPSRAIANTGELQLLIDGKNSVLDIKKMLDAQFERTSELQDVLNYLEVLKAAGLVVM